MAQKQGLGNLAKFRQGLVETNKKSWLWSEQLNGERSQTRDEREEEEEEKENQEEEVEQEEKEEKKRWRAA